MRLNNRIVQAGSIAIIPDILVLAFMTVGERTIALLGFAWGITVIWFQLTFLRLVEKCNYPKKYQTL